MVRTRPDQGVIGDGGCDVVSGDGDGSGLVGEGFSVGPGNGDGDGEGSGEGTEAMMSVSQMIDAGTQT